MSQLTSVALFCIAAMLLFFTVTGNHGVLQLEKINNELAAYEQKNGHLEADIGALEQKIFAVQNQNSALEKVAREELGLAKPNEIVYIFSTASAEKPKTSQR